jgi:outer membrane receptor protein involved in Fe transport
MDAIHYGGEVDMAYQINKKHSFEAMFSIGNWKWNSSEVVSVPQYNITFAFDAKGVHVGDAAQTLLSLSYRWEPIKGMFIKPQFQFFDRYYADFSPFSLQGENGGRDSWKMPSYSLLNIYAGYRIKLKHNGLLVNGSVINILGAKYISDGRPIQGSSTAFEAVGTQVFFGGGLRFNLSLALQF